MQNRYLKILVVLFLTAVASPAVLHGQSNPLLIKADSLFQQKRYTQSFEIYQTLFNEHRYTPSMLLKMAYIQEGLNRISQSAYYLNLYYLATRDEAATAKLEELATKNNLEGYAPGEFDGLFSIYHQYKNLISIALASIVFFLFVLSFVQRFRYKIKPLAAMIVLIVVSIVFVVHLQTGDRYSQAIIVSSNTYLMDAPSAGASVIEIVRDGHRVEVLGKQDVWMKVSWGESEAYIKESNLVPVKL